MNTEDPTHPRVPAWRGAVLLLLLTAALLGGLLVSVSVGSQSIPLGEVWGAVFNPDAAEPTTASIVRVVRAPRAIAGAVVGAALAVAGVLLQGVMRNPLAAPNVVGITSGGAVAAALVFTFAMGRWSLLPPCAFAGALASGFAVYALSWRPGVGTGPVRMVLAGVAVTAILSAITTTLTIASPSARSIVFWIAGSLNAAVWEEVRLIAPYAGGGLFVAMLLSRGLDVLQLGDDAARGVGLAAERTRFLGLACAALLAAAGVSIAGAIGFVGLVVPHIVRFIVGARHIRLIPTSALGGATLLVWADTAVRVLPGQELPVGVITALVGGPFFLFLLWRSKLVG